MMFTALPVAAANTNDNAESSASVNDQMEIKSTNSVGAMVADALGEEEDRQENNNGVNVISVEVEGNVVTAEIESTRDATLVVGIYSEDGSEMIASGTGEVRRDDKTVQVYIPIDTMPQYFFVKAYIIDTNTLKPLCTVYDCPNYTQEMQEFLAKTTEDFEQDRVLNLDDDTTNNFAVYNDSVTLINKAEQSQMTVTADDANRVYVFENAEESILSLTAGQVFSYRDNDNNVVIVKVSAVSVDGTTVTVTGDKLTLADVFDYVKIDGTSDLSTAQIDPSTMDEDMWFPEDETEDPKNPESVGAEAEGSVTETRDFKFKRENKAAGTVISGSLVLSATAHAKVYVTLTQQYLEIGIDYKMTGTLDFTMDNEWEFEMFTIRFTPTDNPIVGVAVYVTPILEFEAHGSLHADAELTGSMGFRASMQSGVSDISRSPELNINLTAEVRLYIGLRVMPEVSVELFPEDPEEEDRVELARASVWGEFGIEAVVKTDLHYSNHPEQNPDAIHDCGLCLAGELFGKLKSGISVMFMADEDKKLSHDFKEKSFKIKDFYYSVTHNSFGWTTCPYIKYRVSVSVVDQYNRPVSGAMVNDKGYTDAYGKLSFYLSNGNYPIVVIKDGKTSTQIAEVKDKAIGLSYKLDLEGSGSGSGSGGSSVPVTGDVIAVDAGGGFSGALTRDGTLYMWGSNGSGQLGDGSTVNRGYPIKINSDPYLPNHSVKQFSLGVSHSAAVTFDGRLYVWGSGNTRYPRKIMDNVTMVACGWDHTAAITTDGSLYTWGDNVYGQLGNGTTTNVGNPTKIMSNVKYVAAGCKTTGAITTDGSLYMWGANANGQVGNGSSGNNVLNPVKIMSNVTCVAIGNEGAVTNGIYGTHSAAISTDGTLYCWGLNNYGRVGDGSKTDRTVPVRIATNTRSVDLGGRHSTAVSNDNALYTWGYNNEGELGIGGRADRTTPQRVDVNIAQSAAGHVHTLALTTDGRVLATGNNNFGQLGCYIGTSSAIYSFKEVEMWDHTPKLSSVGAAADEAVSAGTAKTVTFNGYKPNSIYNFYSMKNKEDGVADDNLLYISQVTTDENGSVTITYTGKDVCEHPAEFLEGLEAVDVSNLTIEAPGYTYNGFEQYYKPVIKNGSYTLCEGIDYTLEGVYFATDAGEYTVVVNGKGVFTGSRAVTFTIAPFDIADATTDGEDEFLYNGSEITPEITVSDDRCTLTEGTDYTINYHNNLNPGVAVAEILGTGNYTGRKIVYFDILSCDISKNSTVTFDSIPTYTGEPITPGLTLTVNGIVLRQDTDFSISYYNNTEPGVGVVDLKGKNGYEGRIVCWFDITECDLAEYGNCSSVKYQIYSGDEQNPEPVVTVQGKRLEKGVDYTVEYENNSEVGTATITVKGIGNYSGVISTSFEIIDENVGDANLDRYVTISDVTEIQRQLAEIEQFNDEQLYLADVNNDGKVTIDDATLIQMYLAEYDVTLGKKTA